jgi:hypothetical protein
MTDTTSRPLSFWAGWISAAVFLLIAAVAGIYVANARNQVDDVTGRLVDAVNKLQMSEMTAKDAVERADAIQANLSLISLPDVAEFALRGTSAVPNARGRVFSSRARGILFSATGLPALLDNQTYQLWLKTKAAPVNVGIVTVAPDGSVTAGFDPVDGTPEATGFMLTIERSGGADAPSDLVSLQ